jgi:two-component system NarL family response regulator
MVRIFVVDDHPVFRHGLISILGKHREFQVIGDAANGPEAVDKILELQPDIVIMDIFMSGGGGVEATAILQQKLPEVNVLILTVSNSEDDLFEAIKAGAKGYLLKTISVTELIESIMLVAKGEAIVSPSMAVRLLEEFKEVTKEKIRKEPHELSQRENEVLQLASKGASNKEIATKLFVSETTVKAHLRSILEKLHARNRAQAVGLAVAKGWLNNSQPHPVSNSPENEIGTSL